jgi:hypothetical protein
MARFVVADISDAKSVLQELRAIVPDLPSVPVQPIILGMQEEPGMFDFFKRFPWFLPTHRYETPAQLLVDLDQQPMSAHRAGATGGRRSQPAGHRGGLERTRHQHPSRHRPTVGEHGRAVAAAVAGLARTTISTASTKGASGRLFA